MIQNRRSVGVDAVNIIFLELCPNGAILDISLMLIVIVW